MPKGQGKPYKSPPTLSKLCLDSFLKGCERAKPISYCKSCRPPSLLTTWRLKLMPRKLVADILCEMAKVEEFNYDVSRIITKLGILDNLLGDVRTANTIFKCWILMRDFIRVRILPYKYLTYFRKGASYAERVTFGLRLSSFLIESGWIVEATHILRRVSYQIVEMKESDHKMTQQLDCLQKLLHCETMIWDIAAGAITLEKLLADLRAHYKHISSSLIVEIYTRASAFELTRHKYKKAHEFSVYTMRYLSESMPKHILVDALRTTAKACMAIRDFEPACTLIKQAISIADNVFGRKHLKFADVMFDYAYFLLIFDKAERAIDIYVQVFNIRFQQINENNFLMCWTNIGLSNAYYLHTHRSRRVISNAISALLTMLSLENLLVISTFRLLFLINESLSFDKYRMYYRVDNIRFTTFLHVQKVIVKSCVNTLGENNIFTARNYFELARIYQASRKYEDSKHNIANYIANILFDTSSFDKNSLELRVFGNYLTQTNEEHDSLLNVQRDPLLLNKIEVSERALEEKSAASVYKGLCNLYPPNKEFNKYLIKLAAKHGWESSSQENNDFWCIEYLKDRYFKDA